MVTTLFSLLIIGLLVGFTFSMPTAGPISILVISNTLHGHRRKAVFIALGAAVVDFLYIFFVVFGFTKIFVKHRASLTYILIIGSIFIFILAIRLWMRSKLHLEEDEEEEELTRNPVFQKIKNRRGFLTGFLVNLLNPMVFVGWLVSSFTVLSFAAHSGINVGGMENIFMKNVEEIQHQRIFKNRARSLIKDKDADVPPATSQRPNLFFQIVNSLTYALSVAFGTVIWFYLFTGLLVRHKKKIPQNFFTYLIRGLAVFLFGIGAYLLYDSIKLIL